MVLVKIAYANFACQTMEVALARVYNWDVVQKRKEKGEDDGKPKGKDNDEPDG